MELTAGDVVLSVVGVIIVVFWLIYRKPIDKKS